MGVNASSSPPAATPCSAPLRLATGSGFVRRWRQSGRQQQRCSGADAGACNKQVPGIVLVNLLLCPRSPRRAAAQLPGAASSAPCPPDVPPAPVPCQCSTACPTPRQSRRCERHSKHPLLGGHVLAHVKQVTQDEQGIGARPPGPKAKHRIGSTSPHHTARRPAGKP